MRVGGPSGENTESAGISGSKVLDISKCKAGQSGIVAILVRKREQGSRAVGAVPLSKPGWRLREALEPDNWNPASTPYTTLYAINILKQIDFSDTSHPILQGIFDFLESGSHFSENGWLFNIPSSNEHPHAPWWTYSIEANELESTGVTAELCAFVIRFFDPGSDLYKNALDIATRIFEGLENRSRHGDMGIEGYCVLLDAIDKAGLQGKYDYKKLLNIVKRLVSGSIEKDTSKWAFYGVRPSNYITSPDSIFYKENEDIVLKELDYLIDTRQENGVWGITWSWFENNEKYQKEFAISENWWKAIKAIEKIVLLRNFSRI